MSNRTIRRKGVNLTYGFGAVRNWLSKRTGVSKATSPLTRGKRQSEERDRRQAREASEWESWFGEGDGKLGFQAEVSRESGLGRQGEAERLREWEESLDFRFSFWILNFEFVGHRVNVYLCKK